MFDHAPPSAGEVRALAHQLLSWADHLASELRAAPAPGSGLREDDRHEWLLGLAVAMRAARRVRAEIFGGIPLGNPNWDVLLDLFVQEMNGFRTSLDHLALSGDLPAATVYECVDGLCAHGLIERAPDRFDTRVVWLSLTASGREQLHDLFDRSAELVRPVVGRVSERASA